MYRFIDFNDEKVDSMLLMELSDLCKTLTKDASFEVEFHKHSYLERNKAKVYVSHFWNHRNEEIKLAGMKSDVFLRAFGNFNFTDYHEILFYEQWCSDIEIPQFAKQLFAMAEDFRVEETCINDRPGMKREFNDRRTTLVDYFRSQMAVNHERNFITDMLLNFSYLILNAPFPFIDFPTEDESTIHFISLYRQQIQKLYEAKNTKNVKDICINAVELAKSIVKNDIVHDYFHLPSRDVIDKHLAYDDQLRKDPLNNLDALDQSASGDEVVFDEDMETWHRETSSPGKAFLQFDLDQGTMTDIMADGAREGEAGDQALGVVQGSAKNTSNKDFSHLETMENRETEKGQGKKQYGAENRHAIPILIQNIKPTAEQILQYQQYKHEVIVYQKKLKRIIDLTLEHKKNESQSNLNVGRLSKNILRFFTDENPRLFYKKQHESPHIDAAFSLLVDCSASMHDKFEETKKGIVLFHEALKSMKIPHEITGFWEDANQATKESQPNYFKQAIQFEHSHLTSLGPEIMDLQAEEDNRDGFAIRIIGERLLKRQEKQKFLIIFSDGEPAAFNYDHNGIVDTHEAVYDMRKKGVEVINIFLSKDHVGEEQKKVFKNIYGQYSLVVESLPDLPDMVFPLLKKLLIKAVI